MTEYWPVLSLAIVALTTALALAFSHLAARHWSDSGKKPRRLVAYTWGTVILWIAFSAWRLMNGDWFTPLGAAIIDVSGGLAVILSYREDKRTKAIRKAKMAEDADGTLKKS